MTVTVHYNPPMKIGQEEYRHPSDIEIYHCGFPRCNEPVIVQRDGAALVYQHGNTVLAPFHGDAFEALCAADSAIARLHGSRSVHTIGFVQRTKYRSWRN